MSAPIHFFECTPSDLRAAVERSGCRVRRCSSRCTPRRDGSEAMTNLSGDTRDRIRGIMQFHRGVRSSPSGRRTVPASR